MASIKKYRTTILSFLFVFLLFSITYTFDNKYTTKGPYGKDGSIQISADRMNQKQLYLIDGWELYWGEYTPFTIVDAKMVQYTFIGEYSNYPKDVKCATYRLFIDYHGDDKTLQLFFPQLNKDAKVYMDGHLLSSDSYDTLLTVEMIEGKHELIVNVTRSGFYNGGMYFVPAIGSSTHIFNQMNIQNVLYMMLICVAAVMGVFAFAAYRKKDAKLYLMYALASFSFAAYVSYHLIYALEFPLQDIAYIIQNVAFYLMTFFSMHMLFLIINLTQSKLYQKVILPTTLLLVVSSLILFALIPYHYACIQYHGVLQVIYRVYIALLFIIIGIYYTSKQIDENQFVVFGLINFAVGLIVNIIDANLFEPIYTFWQFEWCGFILIVTLGRLIYTRYKQISIENETYKDHFDNIVDQRVKEIDQLLVQRKEFYASVAHDLKSPISASHTYIETLRDSHPEIEDEHFQALENKLNEMMDRIGHLNDLSGSDKFKELSRISVNQFMGKVNLAYGQDAAALGIYFIVDSVPEDVEFITQIDKLMIVFENIIFNAFDALNINGMVHVSAVVEDKDIYFTIEDNGKGMNEEQVQQVFNKYFTEGKNGKGTGLGLFIARNIVLEMHGTISVSSEINKGSKFIIKIPYSNS